jgi:hypothetical protein
VYVSLLILLKALSNLWKNVQKMVHREQRVISAAIEHANDLQVQLWFCGVKRV